jgi:hypothetical protein
LGRIIDDVVLNLIGLPRIELLKVRARVGGESLLAPTSTWFAGSSLGFNAIDDPLLVPADEPELPEPHAAALRVSAAITTATASRRNLTAR